jgi:hypothetical protein
MEGEEEEIKKIQAVADWNIKLRASIKAEALKFRYLKLF